MVIKNIDDFQYLVNFLSVHNETKNPLSKLLLIKGDREIIEELKVAIVHEYFNSSIMKGDPFEVKDNNDAKIKLAEDSKKVLEGLERLVKEGSTFKGEHKFTKNNIKLNKDEYSRNNLALLTVNKVEKQHKKDKRKVTTSVKLNPIYNDVFNFEVDNIENYPQLMQNKCEDEKNSEDEDFEKLLYFSFYKWLVIKISDEEKLLDTMLHIMEKRKLDKVDGLFISKEQDKRSFYALINNYFSFCQLQNAKTKPITVFNQNNFFINLNLYLQT